MLSRFHLIPERYGRTDGQTDRFAISVSRVSMLTRDKKISGNFGYMGEIPPPLRDLDQMWHAGRYDANNHVCIIWCGCGERVILPSPIELRCDRVMQFKPEFPCDMQGYF